MNDKRKLAEIEKELELGPATPGWFETSEDALSAKRRDSLQSKYGHLQNQFREAMAKGSWAQKCDGSLSLSGVFTELTRAVRVLNFKPLIEPLGARSITPKNEEITGEFLSPIQDPRILSSLKKDVGDRQAELIVRESSDDPDSRFDIVVRVIDLIPDGPSHQFEVQAFDGESDKPLTEILFSDDSGEGIVFPQPQSGLYRFEIRSDEDEISIVIRISE